MDDHSQTNNVDTSRPKTGLSDFLRSIPAAVFWVGIAICIVAMVYYFGSAWSLGISPSPKDEVASDNEMRKVHAALAAALLLVAALVYRLRGLKYLAVVPIFLAVFPIMNALDLGLGDGEVRVDAEISIRFERCQKNAELRQRCTPAEPDDWWVVNHQGRRIEMRKVNGAYYNVDEMPEGQYYLRMDADAVSVAPGFEPDLNASYLSSSMDTSWLEDRGFVQFRLGTSDRMNRISVEWYEPGDEVAWPKNDGAPQKLPVTLRIEGTDDVAITLWKHGDWLKP